MSQSYIPLRDAETLAWMNNFSAHLSATPAVYGVTAADAANIAGVVAEFATAYAVAADPATRSPMTIIAKAQARATAAALCRVYALQIKYNRGITDADKVALGVRPLNPGRGPSPEPDSSPLLNIIGATPGAQTLRYADMNTPDSGRKPFGVTALQLYAHVGPEPITNPAEATLIGSYTRNPIGVPFDEPDDGKVATYFARWATARGVVGPWSLPVSMTIVA